MITALTPTGARPEAFAACCAMMAAQTYPGPVRWVVVDDGPSPLRVPEIIGWEIVHMRREPYWRPGENTQADNILAGLEHCGGPLAIIEDDDEYAPWWLWQCGEWLRDADLVGESHSLYRHRVTGGQRDMGNDKHASLCSTALKGGAIEALRRICEAGGKGIDVRLWREFHGSKALHKPEPRGVTGVKGWPGRPGIGMGHRL